jgi:type I restriction enzyme S subunit
MNFPSLEEQTAIANFLDRETRRIDALVEEKNRFIELLKEKRQALISHAVTKGLGPAVKMKDSGVEWLGKVPEHWKVIKLSHLTMKIGDGLHGTPYYVEDSEFHFINGNNLVNGYISIAESTKCVNREEFEKHKVDLNNSTLLMSINVTIGNVAFYQGELVMLGKSAAYINCSNQLLRHFLYFLLQSSSINSYFDLQVSGTTIFNLSLESIRNTPVALPTTQEQIEIVDFLGHETAKIDALITESQNSIALLKEHRTALISSAVTGKIDVREAA